MGLIQAGVGVDKRSAKVGNGRQGSPVVVNEVVVDEGVEEALTSSINVKPGNGTVKSSFINSSLNHQAKTRTETITVSSRSRNEKEIPADILEDSVPVKPKSKQPRADLNIDRKAVEFAFNWKKLMAWNRHDPILSGEKSWADDFRELLSYYPADAEDMVAFSQFLPQQQFNRRPKALLDNAANVHLFMVKTRKNKKLWGIIRADYLAILDGREPSYGEKKSRPVNGSASPETEEERLERQYSARLRRMNDFDYKRLSQAERTQLLIREGLLDTPKANDADSFNVEGDDDELA